MPCPSWLHAGKNCHPDAIRLAQSALREGKGSPRDLNVIFNLGFAEVEMQHCGAQAPHIAPGSASRVPAGRSAALAVNVAPGFRPTSCEQRSLKGRWALPDLKRSAKRQRYKVTGDKPVALRVSHCAYPHRFVSPNCSRRLRTAGFSEAAASRTPQSRKPAFETCRPQTKGETPWHA
jgi:hypothetical protein